VFSSNLGEELFQFVAIEESWIRSPRQQSRVATPFHSKVRLAPVDGLLSATKGAGEFLCDLALKRSFH
jgi:hypothetical protein